MAQISINRTAAGAAAFDMRSHSSHTAAVAGNNGQSANVLILRGRLDTRNWVMLVLAAGGVVSARSLIGGRVATASLRPGLRYARTIFFCGGKCTRSSLPEPPGEILPL